MDIRIAIIGGPKTGKTTMAANFAKIYNCGVFHTDALIDLGWSQASLKATEWLDIPGPWVMEGTMLVRALRKWKKLHPGQPPPVDLVIHLWRPHEPQTPGQQIMHKGVETIYKEISSWLHTDKAKAGGEQGRMGSEW